MFPVRYRLNLYILFERIKAIRMRGHLSKFYVYESGIHQCLNNRIYIYIYMSVCMYVCVFIYACILFADVIHNCLVLIQNMHIKETYVKTSIYVNFFFEIKQQHK
jgi:hypothetical protein